ncbi:MAG: Crp/Fnr family transcriptional regulator [Sporichthyaceae bacterium]
MDEVLAHCQGLPNHEFAAGEDLLAEGARTGQIHVLVSGIVGIESGGVLIKRVSEPGSFLGEISALLGTTHSARVVAIEPTVTKMMSGDAITANPEILLGMAKLLAARLHAMTGYLVDLREQYADSGGHLSVMAEVLSELSAARPVTITPGSARDDYDH